MSILRIIKSSEGNEFLSYYPQWTEFYNQIESEFNNYASRIDNLYEKKSKNEQLDNVASKDENVLKRYETWKQMEDNKFATCTEFLRDPSVTIGELGDWLNIKNQCANVKIQNIVPKPNTSQSTTSTSKKKKTKNPTKETSVSTPFTIQQPSFPTPTKKKFNPNREKELASLDKLIDSFKEMDALRAQEEEKPKPSLNTKQNTPKKKSGKKKKTKRR